MIRKFSCLAILSIFLALPLIAEDDLDLPVTKPEKPVPAKPKPGNPPIKPSPPLPSLPPEAPPTVILPTIYGRSLCTASDSIIYVIDVSGSMGWDEGQYTSTDGKIQTGCRLDRAKAELIRSLRSLPKSFKFNLESYDCATYVCFDGTMGGEVPLVDHDDANEATAEKWVTALQPQGATGTGPAVVRALSDRANKLVVLLTDGAPNCGAGDEQGDPSCLAAHLSQIQWGNDQHAVIDVFGIGATGDFRAFCLAVAQQNGGSYLDVR